MTIICTLFWPSYDDKPSKKRQVPLISLFRYRRALASKHLGLKLSEKVDSTFYLQPVQYIIVPRDGLKEPGLPGVPSKRSIDLD